MSNIQKKIKALEALNYREKYWRMEAFKPYPKQEEFCSLGLTVPERLLSAGNQFGKTLIASMECAYHLTGLYPDWWKGRRWSKAVRGAAAGVSTTVTRNVAQKYLCGEPGVASDFGTGSIPKDLFVDKPTLLNGIRDAYDTIQVKHVSGGTSTLQFMSYEQGRDKFQGTTLDFVWDDEELPLDIYVEQCARLTATDGMILVTFTPMKGSKEVYDWFRNKGHAKRKLVNMTVDDALHMTPERIEAQKLKYPKYQWATRLYGQPMQGEGSVFPIDEEAIKEPAIIEIPPHWFKLWGIDFGIGHPFAAVLILYDADADCIHVHKALRMQDDGVGSLPIHHAKAMKMIAAAVPVAWPQDGTAREKGSGQTLASLYKAEGLRMLPEHATHPDGGIQTEPSVMEMMDRMSSGRLKVASNLSEWFEEFRSYHRKDGQIVKERDDLMSATRVAVMARRHAKQVQLGAAAPSKNKKKFYFPDGDDGPKFGE